MSGGMNLAWTRVILSCPQCGSSWFTIRGCLVRSRWFRRRRWLKLTAYSAAMTCESCGHVADLAAMS